MKHAEKLVGVAMALYADYETGENVCPSNGTIAKELGYGGKAPEQTVNKIVGRLRKAGWLTKTGKVPDGPVIYRLTLPRQGVWLRSHTTYIPSRATAVGVRSQRRRASR
ncbi:helix-turn-helix domain-containing protein [Streptomyces sp. ISL-36]|uniref:helix-turn-helix domain-containing protein n=1 Tax=Streptomyces sp. ISL-36 TaxID=2819182 RepID=UPI001BE869A1|nr:helix-turn-helix domain-containing protein [Streptomyces sp. ISL-36]MBT2444871.1 helix-turn-helix domain-containing protein [Streptomyces sp. ISL-36]